MVLRCCGSWPAVVFLLASVVTSAPVNSTAEAAQKYYTFYVSPSRLTWSGGDRERTEAERTGAYVPRNVLFTKVQMLESKAFVLSPRYRPGVPFTVGHFDVADPAHPLEPDVKPFPSAALHDCSPGGHLECLANAVDFALDEPGVLWVLDVGTVHTYGTEPLTVGPPKIWGLNAITGEVVLTVDLSSYTTNRTVLQFIAAEHSADHVMLYVSDSGAGCLLVYNGRAKTVHRLSFPELARGSDERGALFDNDILFMEYVKRRQWTVPGDSEGAAGQVLLTYYAGRHVYALDASSVLDSADGLGRHTSPVAKNVGSKPVRMVLIGSDGADHVYFRDVGRNDAVYAWHVNEPLVERNFALRRRTPDCRRPTHAAPDRTGLVWLLETDVEDFVYGRVGCMGSSSRLQAIVVDAHQREP